jgi:Ca-activated chloride channel homolog
MSISTHWDRSTKQASDAKASFIRNQPTRLSQAKSRRRGSVLVLMAVALMSMLLVSAYCVNLTQLTTAQTEIRLACDAAAKAGAVVLGQTQSAEQARAAAINIAQSHNVSGASMRISSSDVQVGNGRANPNGTYTFNLNTMPLNAVRVNARTGAGATTAAGTYFMSAVSPSTFSLNYTSVATRVDHDLCLVVDRSGSMAWDTSNEPWKYPGSVNADKPIIQYYFLPPHATLSRWAALTSSVNVFLNEVDELPFECKVGLVSYSSNFTFGLYSSEASTIENGLTSNYSALRGSMTRLGSKELIGNTNIASGMQSAITVLTSDQSRLTAKKTMILLTDGLKTQGLDPLTIAQAAANANITIHTITFSSQADQALMKNVAAIGGGNHYHAPNAADLEFAFGTIAKTLPAILTQ